MLTVVHDNAANAVVWGLSILDERHVASHWCAGHRLQLVVNHTLVKDPQISKALGAARWLVEHFRKSELANSMLKNKQKQNGTAQHKLIQYVSIILISSYYIPTATVACDRNTFWTGGHTERKALPLSQRWPVYTIGGTGVSFQALWVGHCLPEWWSLCNSLCSTTGKRPPEVHKESLLWVCFSQVFPNSCSTGDSFTVGAQALIQRWW